MQTLFVVARLTHRTHVLSNTLLTRCRDTFGGACVKSTVPICVLTVEFFALQTVMANTVVMLCREKPTLITPVALLNALMNPPVPEIPKFAQAIGFV